ncbi:MAG: biotin transporter BioY [Mobilicoccus sp.]|nr:biotin transporter BioY [Mobilicoccus sp.]
MTARDLALIATFAALIAVLGLPGAFHPFGQAVPITLQSLGVMLAGALLGWKRGALTIALFIALGAIGLPVFAGGRGGLVVFAGPTIGYIAGYLLGALVIGALVQARAHRLGALWMAFSIAVGGIGVVHLLGIPGMMWRLGLDLPAALVAAAVYIPGDVVKLIVATVVALAVHRALPTLLPTTPPAR